MLLQDEQITNSAFAIDRFLKTLYMLQIWEPAGLWCELFDTHYEPEHESWWKRNAR